MSCPTTEELIYYVFFPDSLDKSTKVTIESHFEKCIECEAVIIRYRQQLKEGP